MSFARGWLDFRQGKPFHPRYDRWPYKRQIAYEEGRRSAAAAARSINKLPRRFNLWDYPPGVMTVISQEAMLSRGARPAQTDRRRMLRIA